MQVNRKTLKKAISANGAQPFRYNKSMYGIQQDPNNFVIYSYGSHFPIALFDKAANRWTLHRQKYSITTTRHQSLVSSAIGVYNEVATVGDLRAIFNA